MFEEVVRLIQEANAIAVVAHMNPDGDAIGSLLATGRILDWLDKRFVLLCNDPVPVRYRFLPGKNRIRTSLRRFSPDLLVALDSNEAPRLGKIGRQLVEDGLPTINIDHHITNDNFGTVNLIHTDWVSTTQGVLLLADALDVPIDRDAATSILTGLVTDTRGFRTANVTPDSLAIASRLMEAGADLPDIVARTLDYKTLPELEIFGRGFSNLHLEDEAIWTALPYDPRLADTATTDLSSTLLGVKGARVSAVFRQRNDKFVEISLRADPGYDVASVAVSIGGGGHTLAAGATVQGALDEVVEQVVPQLKQAVRDGNASA